MKKWLGRYGRDMMVLGADLRDGKVAVSGWLGDTDITIDNIVQRFSLPDLPRQS